MSDTTQTGVTFGRAALTLLGSNALILLTCYLLFEDDNAISTGLAVFILVTIVIFETIHTGLLLPFLTWLATLPISVLMAMLVNLDPPVPDEPDQITFFSLVPIIATGYTIVFTVIAAAVYGLVHVARTALKSRTLEP